MIETNHIDLALYDRAKTAPYFFEHVDRGVLRLSGETRIDFLQRQTTNDLRLLSPAHALVTVLTSPTARILDVILLVDEGETIAIVPLQGRKDATQKFVRSRIFFMDKVAVSDVSDELSLIELGGPDIATALDALGITTELQSGESRALGAGDGAFRIVRVATGFLGSHLILADKPARTAILEVFRRCDLLELPSSLHEILRIEMGVASAATELTDDYTPLEAGLNDTVADGKGCYTGQEVLARQQNYDKVVQRLMGLSLTAPVAPGDALYAGERRVGIITSLIQSPAYGLIGLGYVRRPEFDAGTRLQSAPGGDACITVVELPFGK